MPSWSEAGFKRCVTCFEHFTQSSLISQPEPKEVHAGHATEDVHKPFPYVFVAYRINRTLHYMNRKWWANVADIFYCLQRAQLKKRLSSFHSDNLGKRCKRFVISCHFRVAALWVSLATHSIAFSLFVLHSSVGFRCLVRYHICYGEIFQNKFC